MWRHQAQTIACATGLGGLVAALALAPVASAKVGATTIATMPNGDLVAAWTALVPQGKGWTPASRSGLLRRGATRWVDGPPLPWRGASAAHLAADRTGTLTAVWARQAGGLAAATRPPGGEWSDPQLIDGTGFPDLEVAPNGAAVLLSQRNRVGTPGSGRANVPRSLEVILELAYRPAGARRFEPMRPVASSRWAIRDARVGIDASGTATVAWLRDIGGRWAAESVTRRPNAPSWGAAERIGGEESRPRALALAVASGGRALVALGASDRLDVHERVAGDRRRFAAAHRLPWRPVLGGYVRPNLAAALRPDGSAIVAWDQPQAPIMGVRRSHGGRWGAATSLGEGRGPVHLLPVGDGTLLTWISQGRSPWTRRGRVLPTRGPWRPTSEIALTATKVNGRYLPVEYGAATGNVLWWTSHETAGPTLRTVRWSGRGPVRLPDLPTPVLARHERLRDRLAR